MAQQAYGRSGDVCIEVNWQGALVADRARAVVIYDFDEGMV
jgi:hypothetical protein